MLFICGISQGKKLLDYTKTVICGQCGGYGRYQVFLVYRCFTLFFIPVFKWDRHYYVEMSCCGSIYELSLEKGRALDKGEETDITKEDLTLVSQGKREDQWNRKKCANCGYETGEDFLYCPKCGQRF